MKISDLSKKSGVSQRMLRHFEQLSLLSPERTSGDYRNYKAEDLKRILEIRELQRLGLSLKEIKDLILDPKLATQILEKVFVRERESFLERQSALRDLRERFTGAKYPCFEERIAYSIPNVDKVISTVESQGWRVLDFTYMRFCERLDEGHAEFSMAGEMIGQSSFYLLLGENELARPQLEKLMADFCKACQGQWPHFDGHPPLKIDIKDISELFSPHDIVACLHFSNRESEHFQMVLPYQALFALAKATS